MLEKSFQVLPFFKPAIWVAVHKMSANQKGDESNLLLNLETLVYWYTRIVNRLLLNISKRNIFYDSISQTFDTGAHFFWIETGSTLCSLVCGPSPGSQGQGLIQAILHSTFLFVLWHTLWEPSGASLEVSVNVCWPEWYNCWLCCLCYGISR